MCTVISASKCTYQVCICKIYGIDKPFSLCPRYMPVYFVHLQYFNVTFLSNNTLRNVMKAS